MKAPVRLDFVMRYVLAVLIIFSMVAVNAQSQSTFKRTTATILFSSIGGGVLGLSTLSFYGKPQEHTDNITTGVLVGFIAGLSYVVYDSYSQSQSYYQLNENQKIKQALDSLQNKKMTNLNWSFLSLDYSW